VITAPGSTTVFAWTAIGSGRVDALDAALDFDPLDLGGLDDVLELALGFELLPALGAVVRELDDDGRLDEPGRFERPGLLLSGRLIFVRLSLRRRTP
jgi:hypothetical protein